MASFDDFLYSLSEKCAKNADAIVGINGIVGISFYDAIDAVDAVVKFSRHQPFHEHTL